MICMTMISFRVDEEEARQAQEWATELGVDRSELLRDALRAHLRRLAAERDAELYAKHPLSDEELASRSSAGDAWLPTEDWSNWRDATR